MKLTVFDLRTARFWPQGINLRALLEQAREDYPLLGPDEFDVDATFLLQAISLLRSGVSKRSHLLKLDAAEFEDDWGQVVKAASAALSVLRSECGVLVRGWLSYVALFPSLFAVSTRVLTLAGETQNMATLRRRVRRAGLEAITQCVQAVAADTPGELRLARGYHPGAHRIADSGNPVRAVTLDDLTADEPRRIALIKIDVQGAEVMVVSGALRLIEAHDRQLSSRSTTPRFVGSDPPPAS